MRIQFMPTNNLNWVIAAKQDSNPLFVICFHDHNRPLLPVCTNPTIDSLLAIAADDEEEGPNILTKEQATQIADFASSANNCNATLIICCDGGVGRSAAATAAIFDASKNPELAHTAIFDNGQLSPNRHVYELVREALLGKPDSTTKRHINDEFAHNLVQFKRFYHIEE